MAADEYNDSDQFSEDDVYNNPCAISIIYIHNVCTVTLYNYIYYVYVHICTGHQKYVLCHSSVTCPLKTWPTKKQWQVFIIQFITTLTIIFKCICKLCSLLICQFKQIKIIFAQIVIILKWNNPTVNSYFLLLCKPSPFQGHRQCDKWNFWRQFLCGCYLGHQTVSREHVPFLLACSVGLQNVGFICLT